ncbi:MAG: tetratricopeptide repeat protein [Pyrinomonadaceae bacterium]
MKNLLAKIYSIFFVAVLAIAPVFSQTDSSERMQKGFQLLQSEDFQSAAASFSAILRAEPENDKARLGLAIALVGLDKAAEASREIAKLLARSPKDMKLLEMAAQTFWQQKRFTETEKVLKRRLDLGDAAAEWWALYGDALDAQKKTIEAVVAYEKAVKAKPDSINYRYALGSLYWKQIRYDDATREFTEILKREPKEPRASFNLGDIYLTNGDAAKAVPFLEIAVVNFPEEFDTRFALGRAYLLTNKYQPAIEQLKIAVKLRPEIAEGFYQLGLALQKSGRREEAKPAFKKTQELQKAKRDSEAPPTIPKNNQ